MATKKLKITVTKKKISLKKILVMLTVLLCLVFSVVFFLKCPIKNIYISGNNILSDKYIISLAELDNYPAFFKSYFLNIKEDLLKDDYIKNVQIKRKLFGKIYIKVIEHKPICIYEEKVVLSSKKKVANVYNINYLPYVSNNIDSIYDKFVSNFSKIDSDILLKISHIEYAPNDVDKERFILYMVDKNYVYVTLSKIEKINKYNLIVNQLDNKKGIIYLDSGDYVEIKDNENKG